MIGSTVTAFFLDAWIWYFMVVALANWERYAINWATHLVGFCWLKLFGLLLSDLLFAHVNKYSISCMRIILGCWVYLGLNTRIAIIEN